MDSISLTQKELLEYVRYGCRTEFKDMEHETELICRAIGMFFATNLNMTPFTADIQKITLTPQDGDLPPTATLSVKRGKRIRSIKTDDSGCLPTPLPFRRRKKRRGRKRRRKR